jgi:ubiquinone/menaquinone biosynthesis C-methylase UbiE
VKGVPAGPEARARLILALNEIWHDLENRAYDAKHPDILEAEIPRWDRALAAALPAQRGPVRALDLGSGTGFVPSRLKGFLREGDRLICSDVSAGMLEACRARVEAGGRAFALETLKLDGRRIDLPDASLDLVTANAVMHHLPRPAEACREIDRVLKPGGLVLIGHEPTRAYGGNRMLAASYWALLPLADFKQCAYEIILRLGWFEALRGPLGRLIPELGAHNRLIAGLNARLREAGLIEAPLDAATVSALLDAQSPNAGGPQAGRGFAFSDFEGYFPGYRMERRETYAHLGKIHPRARWMRRYERWLSRRYPEEGANLFCALRKGSS